MSSLLNGETASNNLQVPRVFSGGETNLEASARQQRDFKPPALLWTMPKFKMPLPATLTMQDKPEVYAPFLDGRHYNPVYNTIKVPYMEGWMLKLRDQQIQTGWVLVND